MMIVIVPTIGKTKVLVAPTSAPLFPVIKASSRPAADEPKAVCIDALLLNRWDF